MIRLLNGTLAVQEIIASEKSLTIEQDIEGAIEHPCVCGSPNYVRSILAINVLTNVLVRMYLKRHMVEMLIQAYKTQRQ